ncbi:MAG: ABC transporter ATP-binding protein [Pseudomonadota bacterium]
MSLQVQNISYAYGQKTALDDVSFTIKRGAFCALLGPNGAGKSTLYALLTRLQLPASGQIEIAGYDLAAKPRLALARLGVVFQQSTLDLDLTVRQNMRYFAALHGLSGRLAETKIDAALDRLEMKDRAQEKARALNGGHRRRTEIARALIHTPDILLLDEATVGLDAATRHAITGYVHQLAQDGTTVLWATHLTDEVWPEDRLILLHKARILHDGQANDLGLDLKSAFLERTGAQE